MTREDDLFSSALMLPSIWVDYNPCMSLCHLLWGHQINSLKTLQNMCDGSIPY